MKRKFLSGLLALSMVLTLLPGTALAAGETLTIAPKAGASGLEGNETDGWTVEATTESKTIALEVTLAGLADGTTLAADAEPTVKVTDSENTEMDTSKVTVGKFTDNVSSVTIDIANAAAGAYTVAAEYTIPGENDGDAGTPVNTATPFEFTITEAAPATYTVSGKVLAGNTGVTELTNIDVQLYKSTDGERGDAVGSAVKTVAEGAFSFDNVAAGTYVAVVAAAAGSYKESASAEFTVATDAVSNIEITLVAEDAQKTTLTASDFTVTGNTLTYGDALTGVKVAITDDATTTVTVTYQKENADVTPKDAGTYDIMAAVAESDTYNEFTATKVGTLTINKAELTVTPKDVTLNNDAEIPEVTALEYDVTGLKYDDTAETIMNTVTMAYYDENGTSTATPEKGTAGTFTIKVESADLKTTDGNYTLSATNGTGTLKILAAGETAPESIAVAPETLALKMGGTESGTITATVTPEGATGEITFTSSDTSVATVEKDADGDGTTATVTAVAEGTATITAAIGGFEAECAVTVEAADAAATAAAAGTVTGTVDEALADAKITITIANGTIAADEAVKIANYEITPAVDGATFGTPTVEGQVITIPVTGTPTAASTADIAVTVKAAVISGASADITATSTAKWAIAEAAPKTEDKAEIANVTITGEAEKALEGAQTIVITLTGDAIDATAAAEKTNYTIANMPTGVDFTVTYDEATQKATLAVTGTPEAACDAAISVTINKAVFGADADVTTVANANAKWAITRAAIAVDTAVAEKPNVSVDDNITGDAGTAAGVVADAIEASGEALDLSIDDPAATPADDATQDAIDAAIPDSSEKETIKQTITDKSITALSSTDAADLKTVVQTYMDIAIKEVELDTQNANALTSITFDVTPMYRVVATNQAAIDGGDIKVYDETASNESTANAVQVAEGEVNIKAGETVTVKIPLGDNALGNESTLYVTHIKDSGAKYYYTGTVSGKILSFDNPHGFSTMIVSAEPSEDILVELTHGGKTVGYDALTDITIANGDTLAFKKVLDANVTIPLSEAEMSFTITVQGADEEAYAAQEAFIEFEDVNGYTVSTDRTDGTITVTVEEEAAPDTWTVTFDSQGGSNVASASVAKDGDGKVTKPADPTRSGYKFGGWYKEASCTTAWDFDSDTVAADTTLYAKWTKNSSSNKRPSSGGGGGASTTTATVNISSDDSSIKADVKISGGTATIGKVENIKKVVGDGVVSVDLSTQKKDIDTVKVDSSIVNAIANSDDNEGMEIKLSDGTVTLDADAVASLKGGDLTVKLDKVNNLNSKQKDAVKDMDVQANYELTINKALKNGEVEVRIPFAVPDGKSASDMALVRVADSGTAEEVSARFSGGEVRFTATESGDYVIVAKEAQASEPVEPETPVQNNNANFSDVDSSAWYGRAVDYVVANGLMSGVGNGQFAPNTNLSRAMLAQILYNQAGRPAAGDAAFNDVAAGMWYSNAIAWAAAQGVVSGYGNGMFGPNDNITREQLAVMLYRYAGSPAADGSLDSFADAGKVSGYAQNALVWATGNGIMSGKGGGNLDPAGLATRAEVAQMLYNYLGK